MVECTITSAALANLSTCSDADEDRGGNGTSLCLKAAVRLLGTGFRFD